jgi:hypothetical protein
VKLLQHNRWAISGYSDPLTFVGRVYAACRFLLWLIDEPYDNDKLNMHQSAEIRMVSYARHATSTRRVVDAIHCLSRHLRGDVVVAIIVAIASQPR